jgi:hypothetical protein
MRNRPIISAVLTEGGAAFALTTFGSRGNANARRGGVVRDLASASAADIRAAAGDVPRNASLVLVAPTSACAVRPAAMDRAMFSSARDEVERSATELFPLAEGDAMIGFIARAPSTGPSSPAASDDAEEQRGGYLIAASASRVEPARRAIEDALGVSVSRILAPQMAMLGLGLQHMDHAVVDEPSPFGSAMLHTLQRGVVRALAEPESPMTVSDAPDARLPAALDTEDDERAAIDLAVAAALAPRVAPQEFTPLSGRAPRGPRHWVRPALAAGIAVALFIAASSALDARYAAARDAVLAEQTGLAPAVDAVMRARGEYETLAADLEAIARLESATPTSAFPALVAAVETLPTHASLERLRVEPGRIVLEGFADEGSTVLARIEANDAFAGARPIAAAQQLPEPVNKESFEIAADRRRVRTSTEGGS